MINLDNQIIIEHFPENQVPKKIGSSFYRGKNCNFNPYFKDRENPEFYTSSGKYHYYNRWLLVDCCEDLAAYYRVIIFQWFPSVRLQPPKNKSHITVIAGKYEPTHDERYWKKFDGYTVEFQYDPENINNDGVYFWLPVYCKHFEELRVELGLTPTIPIPWHLTIGNLK